MNRQLKTLIRDSLRFVLGKYAYTWLRFVITHRYIPNFKKPRSMNEKIQYRKLFDDPSKFSKYATKYTVRKFVENTIGKEYLVKLYKAKNFIAPADFDDLPDSFVIKTSNGGGGVNVQIIKNKADLNLQAICDRFNGYLKVEAGKGTDELFYGLEEPLILFERLLEPTNGELQDFKWHVFNARNGQPKLFLQIDSNRQVSKFAYCRSIFDEHGNRLKFQWGRYKPIEYFELPEESELMKKLAIKLAEPFNYVRVDMYLVDGQVYFSELTFCNDSGFGAFSDKKYDFEFGQLWDEY